MTSLSGPSPASLQALTLNFTVWPLVKGQFLATPTEAERSRQSEAATQWGRALALSRSAVVLNTELANSPQCFGAVCRQFTVRVHGAEPIRFGQGVKCATAPYFAALPMQ